MLTSRGIGTVLGDLAALGFNAEWGVLSAADVGAPHLRERIWILAYADGVRKLQPEGIEQKQRGWVSDSSNSDHLSNPIGFRRDARRCNDREHDRSIADAGDQHNGEISNALCNRSQGQREVGDATRPAGLCGGARSDKEQHLCHPDSGVRTWRASTREEQTGRGRSEAANWWAAEPDVGRVAHWVAARVDRLKAIGNGQVPRVATTAWQLLDRLRRA